MSLCYNIGELFIMYILRKIACLPTYTIMYKYFKPRIQLALGSSTQI